MPQPPSPPQAGLPHKLIGAPSETPGALCFWLWRPAEAARVYLLWRPAEAARVYRGVPGLVRRWWHPMNANGSLPRIQCSTGPFWAYELEIAMDALAEAGFTDIELMVTRDPRTQVPEIPLRLAEERGLHIASIHGPFLVITKSVWGLDPVEKINRGIEMCQAVGADSLIVHPPYLWERNYAHWVAEKAEASETETGVKVAVETMYPKWVAGRRVRAYRWLEPKALALACHRTALDTSHLAVSREDIFDAFDILAPNLVHIHLSNNNGDGRDGHLEVEQGVLPLGRFLEHVHRAGYKGVISLELSVRKYLQRPRELSEMLKRNREYVEEKLQGRPKMAKGMPR